MTMLHDVRRVEVLEGHRLRGVGLVAEWATLHRDELRDDWDRARQGLPLKKIAPLE